MGNGADCETISLGDIFDFEPTVVAKELAPAFRPFEPLHLIGKEHNCNIVYHSIHCENFYEIS